VYVLIATALSARSKGSKNGDERDEMNELLASVLDAHGDLELWMALEDEHRAARSHERTNHSFWKRSGTFANRN
jgi:hypothetical protein